MDFKTLQKLYIYLAKNNIDSIRILGGEPTLYSCFLNACVIAQKYFKSVSVLTNATNNNILLFIIVLEIILI